MLQALHLFCCYYALKSTYRAITIRMTLLGRTVFYRWPYLLLRVLSNDTLFFFCSAFGLPEWWKLLYMYIVDAAYRYKHFHGSIIFRYMYRLSTDFISLIYQRNSLDHIISSKNSQRSKDFAFKAYFQRFFWCFWWSMFEGFNPAPLLYY